MLIDQARPWIYLITSGVTTSTTTPESQEFSNILNLIAAATAAEVSLVQLREKALSARVLYELTLCSVVITRGTRTRLLVNDRFDIALAAGADGVQLTSISMSADTVRQTCGSQFVIGVSTHSCTEAQAARERHADFVLFGPVFETESKRTLGAPQGLTKLREVTHELNDFPVIAIGGISIDNAAECFEAGAIGIAGITMLSEPATISSVVNSIRSTQSY
jgi:thiamine-phosphate diphosphorylase